MTDPSQYTDPQLREYLNADDDNEPDERNEDDENDVEALKARLKAVNREAKMHRLKAKEAARELRTLRAKHGEDNSSASSRDLDQLRIENAVLRVANRTGIDPDLLELKLRKAGMLVLDEDGDLPEEFDETAERIAAEARGNGGPRPPKSPHLSGRKAPNNEAASFNALAKRYPALLQNRGTL